MKNKRNVSNYEIFKIVGENIQKARISKNITIKQLSIGTGIREKYLEKIEKGEAIGITTTKLFKIADVLGVKVWTLVNQN